MAVNGVVIAMLTTETVSDIRTRSVSVIRLLVFLAIATTANIIFGYQSVWSMAGGMAVGAVMFLYALATKESIGYGDCLVFVCAGAFLGFSKNLRLLFGSFIAATVAGAIYSVVRHKGMKARIPFIPCILATFVIGILTEGII